MARHTVDCSGSLFFTTRYSLTVDVDSCYVASNLGKMMMMTPGFRVNKDTGGYRRYAYVSDLVSQLGCSAVIVIIIMLSFIFLYTW